MRKESARVRGKAAAAAWAEERRQRRACVRGAQHQQPQRAGSSSGGGSSSSDARVRRMRGGIGSSRCRRTNSSSSTVPESSTSTARNISWGVIVSASGSPLRDLSDIDWRTRCVRTCVWDFWSGFRLGFGAESGSGFTTSTSTSVAGAAPSVESCTPFGSTTTVRSSVMLQKQLELALRTESRCGAR